MKDIKEVEIDQSVVEEALVDQRGKYVAPTTKYTVMLIPDSTEPTKIKEISFDRIMKVIVSVSAVSLILLCLLISSGIRSYRKSHDGTASIRIKQLEDTIVSMKTKETSLSEHVTELESALADKIRAEHVRQEQLVEERIPNSEGVEGVAILLRNSDSSEGNEFRNIYNAMSGTLVLATGSGVVKGIDSDAVFGNRMSIDHGNGFVTNYFVPVIPRFGEGEEVSKGDVLAVISDDNQMIAYEIEKDGIFVNSFEIEK